MTFATVLRFAACTRERSCRHQIKDLAGRTALHPLEIVADAMRKT
jgi:hypothetical protein